ENGGTAKNIISVGSYNNRVNWTDYTGVFRSDSTIPSGKISNFSSRGPTIDGRMKPDITAPGQYIASSYHKDQVPGWLKNQILSLDTFDGDPVYYAMASGTSMASPHVAGIVALALEKSGGLLDVERMKLVLESSYYRDGYTGSDANNTYGIGKIDAIQTLFNSIEFMNVVSDHENLAPVVIFNENEMKVLTNHNIQYENFKVYDLSARVLIQNSLKNNKIINLKPLPIGLYLVELNSKEGKVIGKVFKSN
ncbi:MAG: S8 family peptidase, partial [Bacteroidia bacterium]